MGKNNRQKTLVISIVVLLLLIYAIQNGFILSRQIYRDLRFIVQNPQMNYDDKMRIYWWGVYDLLKFVKENTPENARIAIPPQTRPFLTSGNVGIVRYFIYPRKPISTDLNSENLTGIDYVLITYGEWEDAPKEKYGWPKQQLVAEKVLYFNPVTKEVTTQAGDYIPERSEEKKYGLIYLKK